MLLALLLAQATPVAPAPVPDRAILLDRLLAAHDYMALGTTINSPDSPTNVGPDLDWMKARMLGGSSAFVSMFYARSLWAVAGQMPDTAGDQLRETAALAMLHAYGATTTDGARCGDATAPQHRRDQIATFIPRLWAFVAKLPPERRQRLVDTAVLLDARTAATRAATGDDEFLCRAGMEEMTYNLQHGTTKEVPTPPGHVGRTMVTSGDGKYRPSLVPASKAQAAVAAARSGLRALFSRLVTPS